MILYNRYVTMNWIIYLLLGGFLGFVTGCIIGVIITDEHWRRMFIDSKDKQFKHSKKEGNKNGNNGSNLSEPKWW